MRPRKNVLLVCENENRLAELRFILDLRGYRVIGGLSSSGPIPDVALVTGKGAAEQIRAISATLPDVQILALVRDGKSLPAMVLKPDAAMDVVLDMLKTMAIRKSGPKKASVARPGDRYYSAGQVSA